MNEDYGSILKEVERLTPNERIKYMVKQQEEFLNEYYGAAGSSAIIRKRLL